MTISAVFLDLYQTLAYFHPEREQRQSLVLKEYGFEVELDAIRRAYLEADHDFTLVGMKTPLHRMSREERHPIYVRFQRVLMETLGLGHVAHLAEEIYMRYWELHRDLRLYPDVMPALGELREMGCRLGLITNVTDDPSKDIEMLGLKDLIDTTVASCVEGIDKPHPRIFQVAMSKLGTTPDRAVHVGDQLLADVEGATSAGMKAILLDRYDIQNGRHRPRIRSLLELPPLLRKGLE